MWSVVFETEVGPTIGISLTSDIMRCLLGKRLQWKNFPLANRKE